MHGISPESRPMSTGKIAIVILASLPQKTSDMKSCPAWQRGRRVRYKTVAQGFNVGATDSPRAS
jgi:hypothetical protein